MIVERVGDIVSVSARLDIDARRGQEARLEGSLRLAGARGKVTIASKRIEGVPVVTAWARL